MIRLNVFHDTTECSTLLTAGFLPVDLSGYFTIRELPSCDKVEGDFVDIACFCYGVHEILFQCFANGIVAVFLPTVAAFLKLLSIFAVGDVVKRSGVSLIFL
ncbi:MAG: hypothetical protein MR319_06435 [Mediterranea sp.]|nr:hypothetical protein [Mediterranea sp.]